MSFFRDGNKPDYTADKVISACFDKEVINNGIPRELVQEKADFIDGADVASRELNAHEATLR